MMPEIAAVVMLFRFKRNYRAILGESHHDIGIDAFGFLFMYQYSCNCRCHSPDKFLHHEDHEVHEEAYLSDSKRCDPLGYPTLEAVGNLARTVCI